MISRGAVLVLACAPASLVACFQELDTGAATAAAQADDASPGDLSTWELCQSPSCDGTDGTIPFLQQTPPIYLPDGGTTTDPCVDVEQASMSIRQTYCASCHGASAGAGQGGFKTVLDDTSLVSGTTTNATFPRFVVPGDPYGSYLYVAISNGQMPPAAASGATPSPAPTAADLSVLYGWIQACFPGPNSGYVNGGGFYGPGSDAGSAAGAPTPGAGSDAGVD
jgi:hypothetical protein